MKEEEYNPLKIPPDWDVAHNHYLARRTGPDVDRKTHDGESNTQYLITRLVNLCPCCGFEIERENLPFPTSIISLSFLGAGFPLFYNFIRYCIIILFL